MGECRKTLKRVGIIFFIIFTIMADIYIQVIFDAAKILKDHSSASTDPNNPTGLAHNPNSTDNYMYMIVANELAMSGQATGDLHFRATTGSTVRFHADTTSNNFDHSALIYKIDRYGGENVLRIYGAQQYEKQVPVYNTNNENGLPCNKEIHNLNFFEASVQKYGTENFRIYFVLYGRDGNDGVSDPRYFYWDPAVSVPQPQNVAAAAV